MLQCDLLFRTIISRQSWEKREWLVPEPQEGAVLKLGQKDKEGLASPGNQG